MTLSKNQKTYRKRKKIYSKDIHVITGPSGYRVPIINPKPLCVRVSLAAYEKLKAEAEHHGWSLKDTLNHILNCQIQKHSKDGDTALRPHVWEMELITPDTRGNKRKGTNGTKMLNYEVSSTTWNKLQCEANTLNYSKARLVEQIILNYRHLSEGKKACAARHQQRVKDLKEFYDRRLAGLD